MRPLLNRQTIKTALSAVVNRVSVKLLYYIIEGGNWSVDHDGYSITRSMRNVSSVVTRTCSGIRNSIVHFGSIHTFWPSGWARPPHKSNKTIVTWFHISDNKKPAMLVPEAAGLVDLWHTSCSLTRDKLVRAGVPEAKVLVIPLGVDLKTFHSPTPAEKGSLRSRLGVPPDKIVIGCFQKDGHGWAEGLEPKLIKGPDIFCDVVERLAKRYDLFVLLTGPARGYVKKRLEQIGVPYVHRFLAKVDDVAKYYRAIDLYLVTSREEGGPKSILESWASGVPLISTKAGMAPDVIIDGENGFLCEIDDVDEIVRKSILVLDNQTDIKRIVDNGLAAVQDFDWSCIAQQYEDRLYRRFLC